MAKKKNPPKLKAQIKRINEKARAKRAKKAKGKLRFDPQKRKVTRRPATAKTQTGATSRSEAARESAARDQVDKDIAALEKAGQPTMETAAQRKKRLSRHKKKGKK